MRALRIAQGHGPPESFTLILQPNERVELGF